jgi:hypothetical protein
MLTLDDPPSGVPTYSPVEPSWLTKAHDDIGAHRPFRVVLTHHHTAEVFTQMRSRVSSGVLTGFSTMTEILARIPGASGASKIPAMASMASTALLMGNLGALGAELGLAGALVGVIGAAHQAGLIVKPGVIIPGDLQKIILVIDVYPEAT